MSKLNEHIKHLSHNNVKYKKLKNISEMKRGTSLTKAKANKGNIPVISGGREPAFYCDTFNREGGIITVAGSGAGAGYVQYWDTPIFANDCFTIKGVDQVDTKYLYYCLTNIQGKISDTKKGGGVPHVHISDIENFKIPVPSLDVQYEIVHILDSFIRLTEELTAELVARKKQYVYYRDELLNLNDTIPMVKLKEISTSIYRGAGIKRDQVKEEGIPCVRYGEIYTTYNTWFDKCVSHTKEEYISSPKYFEYGDILFAITGESVEDIAKSIAYIGHEKCLAGSDIVVMKHKQNPRYLAHVLNTSMARQQKSKGKVKSKVVHSNVSSIEQIEIPLPSLEVQKRYADVLDNFEKICNDLNIGLPAEIEARQKQYEYYRDLLLTFAETGNTILTDRQTDRQTYRQTDR